MTSNHSHEFPTTPSAPLRGLFSSIPERAPADVQATAAQGKFDTAFIAAIASGDLDIAVDVLRVGWFELLRDDQLPAVRQALEKLSTSELNSRPLLAMALGLAYNADGFRRTKAVYYSHQSGVLLAPKRCTTSV